MIILVASIFFMYSASALAFYNNGNTEVFAHIEASSSESTPNETDDNSAPATHDETDTPTTGYIISDCVIVASLLLVVSLLVIYLCRKKETIGTDTVIDSMKTK